MNAAAAATRLIAANLARRRGHDSSQPRAVRDGGAPAPWLRRSVRTGKDGGPAAADAESGAEGALPKARDVGAVLRLDSSVDEALRSVSGRGALCGALCKNEVVTAAFR
jgi:hypothetical protein